MRPSTTAIVVLLATACALQCSDSYDLGKALPPCVPAHITQILASEDEPRLRAYAREAGMMQTLDLYSIVDKAYDVSSAEHYARSERVLSPAQRRLARVIEAEFRLSYYSRMCEAIAARPLDERADLRRRMHQSIEVVAGEATPQAIATVEQNVEHFEREGFPYGAELAHRCLVGLYANAKDGAAFDRHARRVLELQRELGYERMLAQSLGGRGDGYSTRGDIDSMHVCWSEALRIATEYRMPDQAPRLMNFYARFYRKQGQSALAHDMLRESVAVADAYGAGHHRQRFVIELADFYKSFQYWDLASRLVDRARVVVTSDFCNYINPDKLLILQAEILMGTGRPEEAHRIYEQIWSTYSGHTAVGVRALTLRSWASGWIDNGQPERAIGLIDRGLDLATGARMSLWLLRARASYDTGKLAGCDDALDQFELLTAGTPAPHSDWLMHDALRVDASIARGDTAVAWQHAAAGLERLILLLSSTDASVDGYLTVARAARFRESLHRLAANDPVLGYGAALFWVESYRLLGGHTAVKGYSFEDSTPRASVENILREAAERSRAAMANMQGVHLTYAIVGNDVLRWTTTSDGIVQDKLAIRATALRELISDACEEIAPFVHSPSTHSAEKIARLSTLLLPKLPAPGACILVTPDGWLGTFPFEVLNIERDHYTALLAKYDVAYLRPGATSSVPPVVSPPLVFVSPEPQGSLTQRFPFQPTLRAASEEAATVRAALPGARLLTGQQATRAALMSSWRNSSLVYIIGHVLRDPEAPYMVMIPASPREDSRESAYVEVSDIRSTDLSRCGLVVLSGCSSGLPYAGQGTSAPSLAQACIDAGARSVVHTFWDIDDRVASELMTDFMRKRSQGMTAIHALAESRRARMQAAGAGTFEWASYGIVIDSAELVRREGAPSGGSR